MAENGAAGTNNPAQNSGNSIVEYNTASLGAAAVTLTNALLSGPTGLAFDPTGKLLYIVNNGNNTVVTYNTTAGASRRS